MFKGLPARLLGRCCSSVTRVAANICLICEVLATDMARHMEHVTFLKAMIEMNRPDKAVQLVMENQNDRLQASSSGLTILGVP